MYDSSKNRFFSRVANANQATPIFSYVWSPNEVSVGEDGRSVSGIWRPTITNSDGRLLVDIGTGINISANSILSNANSVNPQIITSSNIICSKINFDCLFLPPKKLMKFELLAIYFAYSF